MAPLIVPISELRNNLSHYAHLARYKGRHIRVQKNKTVLFDIVPPQPSDTPVTDPETVFASYVGIWKDLPTDKMLRSIRRLRKKSAQELRILRNSKNS